MVYVDASLRYASLFANLFEPVNRALLMKYRQQLEEEALRRRAEQIAQELQNLQLPSPIGTDVIGGYTPEPLREPELQIGYRSPRQTISELFKIPEEFTKPYQLPTTIVEYQKSPITYMKDIYRATLPTIGKLATLGVNISPIINNLIETYAEEYKTKREEEKEKRELLRKFKTNIGRLKTVIKKYNANMDEDEITSWALSLADGSAKWSDFLNTIRGKYQHAIVKTGDGRALFTLYDKDTGRLVKSWEVRPDLNLIRATAEAKERVKAKYRQAGKKRSWKLVKREEPISFEEFFNRYYNDRLLKALKGVKDDDKVDEITEQIRKEAWTKYNMLLESGKIPKKLRLYKVYEDTSEAIPVELPKKEEVFNTDNVFLKEFGVIK